MPPDEASRVDRVILLSGSLGLGHDTLAQACAGSLEARGARTRTLDSLALLGGGLGATGDWVFRRLLAVTPVYDAFHFSQLRDGGAVGRFADRASLRVAYPRFEAVVREFTPDLVVSVFATGAAIAARYKREGAATPSVVFVTDAVAHRMWVHDETDLFLVTSTAAAASVRRYRPRAEVMVVTAPVRPGFYAPPDASVARKSVGVPDDARCALLMSGGWGIGPIDDVARRLASAGVHVLAVAGHNARLEAGLRTLAAAEPRVHAFGYTERVPELMVASDVVVTSAGDTCREARAVGRRMVLLDVVPGHGRENLMHELERGGAAVSSLDPATITESVLAAAESEEPQPRPEGSPGEWDDELARALARLGIEVGQS